MSTSPTIEREQLEPGARIGGHEVLAHVHRGAHEIVQVRGAGGVRALKLGTREQAAGLTREARMLDLLAGTPVPSLVEERTIGERPYLTIGWCPGCDPRTVAAELRATGDRAALIGLCAEIAGAHAALHDRGVLHGHIHPRHLLVDASHAVAIVDLGSAAGSGGPPQVAAAAGPLSAPEHVEAGGVVTARSEQYALAALAFLLLTGRMYLPSARTRAVLVEQIVRRTPSSFADVGVAPWPQVEELLGRALRKDPAARFPALVDLEGALRGAAAVKRTPRVRPDRLGSNALDAVLADFLAQTAVPGELLAAGGPPPPRCSVNYGSAGIALAHLRLARLDASPDRLAAAQAWLAESDRASARPGAFHDGDGEVGLTPDSTGDVSIYHTEAGVHGVGALVAGAADDGAARERRVDAFVAASARRCDSLDLTLGRSSALLGCALLLDALGADSPAGGRLLAHGDRLSDEISRAFRIADVSYLGIAHGSAGILYALLLWADVRAWSPSPLVRERLLALAALAEPSRRGVRWPRTRGTGLSRRYWVAWCNGAAGHVFVWTLAHRMLDHAPFGQLAEAAAWTTWEHPGPEVSSLCCGTAGRAYALLNLYRSTGSEQWLERASRLATAAAADLRLAGDARSPTNLYKGHAGLALLARELVHPQRSAMPMFEPEPGSARGARGRRRHGATMTARPPFSVLSQRALDAYERSFAGTAGAGLSEGLLAAAHARRLRARLPSHEVVILEQASSAREEGLAQCRGGRIDAGEALLAEARSVLAADLSHEARTAGDDAQHAADAYLCHRRGDPAAARRHLLAASRCAVVLGARYGYDVEPRRIHLACNIIRAEAATGDRRQALRLVLALVRYVDGEPSCWPFPSVAVDAPFKLESPARRRLMSQVWREVCGLLTSAAPDATELWSEPALDGFALRDDGQFDSLNAWLAAIDAYRRGDRLAFLEQAGTFFAGGRVVENAWQELGETLLAVILERHEPAREPPGRPSVGDGAPKDGVYVPHDRSASHA